MEVLEGILGVLDMGGCVKDILVVEILTQKYLLQMVLYCSRRLSNGLVDPWSRPGD